LIHSFFDAGDEVFVPFRFDEDEPPPFDGAVITLSTWNAYVGSSAQQKPQLSGHASKTSGRLQSILRRRSSSLILEHFRRFPSKNTVNEGLLTHVSMKFPGAALGTRRFLVVVVVVLVAVAR
jgi:hypothetical protein